MKRIILTLLFAFSLSLMAQNEPKFLLEYHCTNKRDINALDSLKTDKGLKGYYEFNPSVVDTFEYDVTYVIDKKTGIVLGTFMGRPSKGFLIEVYNKNLTDEYLNDIIPKLVALKQP